MFAVLCIVAAAVRVVSAMAAGSRSIGLSESSSEAINGSSIAATVISGRHHAIVEHIPHHGLVLDVYLPPLGDLDPQGMGFSFRCFGGVAPVHVAHGHTHTHTHTHTHAHYCPVRCFCDYTVCTVQHEHCRAFAAR